LYLCGPFYNLVNMGRFSGYSLPILGLKTGIHRFEYDLDPNFFAQFEDSPLASAWVHIDLIVDKRPDMYVLSFVLLGKFQAECDRCTAEISLPISGDYDLFLKYGDLPGEEDDDVVFIGRDWSDFNVAKFLYEFCVLSLPITNTYDCENDAEPPCNFDVLAHIAKEENTKSDDPVSNPVWDALKNLNTKK